jgi:hypothetical protein
MKMKQTQRSKKLALKIQTPGNHPKERIQHSEQGKSLKSRTLMFADPYGNLRSSAQPNPGS